MQQGGRGRVGVSVVSFQACVCVRSSSTCSRRMNTSNYSQPLPGWTHLSVIPLLAAHFQMDRPGENGLFPLIFLRAALYDYGAPCLPCAPLSSVSAFLRLGSWQLPD